MLLFSNFTAKPWQVTTYLLGVTMFSISFLVFMNSAVSFVITDVVGQITDVGKAAGDLGLVFLESERAWDLPLTLTLDQALLMSSSLL